MKTKLLRARLEQKWTTANLARQLSEHPVHFPSYVDCRKRARDRATPAERDAVAGPFTLFRSRPKRPKRDPVRDDIAYKQMMSKRSSNPFQDKARAADADRSNGSRDCKARAADARKRKTKAEREADQAYIERPCPW